MQRMCLGVGFFALETANGGPNHTFHNTYNTNALLPGSNSKTVKDVSTREPPSHSPMPKHTWLETQHEHRSSISTQPVVGLLRYLQARAAAIVRFFVPACHVQRQTTTSSYGDMRESATHTRCKVERQKLVCSITGARCSSRMIARARSVDSQINRNTPARALVDDRRLTRHTPARALTSVSSTTATRTMSGLVSAWLTYDQRRTLNEITNLLRRWQLQDVVYTDARCSELCAFAGCAVSRPCAAVRDFSVLLCLCAVKVFFETW